MGKTMVLGLSDSESMRRSFEEQFAESLGANGVEAVTAHSLVPTDKELSEEQFLTLLKEQSVDTLILTRVVGEQDRLRYNPPVVHPRPYYTHYGYYNWTYDQVYAPGYVEDYVEIHLETNLYDVQTSKLIWSGQKKVTDETSAKSNLRNVIKAVVKDLKKQGLMEPAGS